jgi:ribonuclease Z
LRTRRAATRSGDRTGRQRFIGSLLTHLHSDHIADLGDLLITRWVTTFAPDPVPLPIIGPPGTAAVVEATLKAFGPDISYRIAHMTI